MERPVIMVGRMIEITSDAIERVGTLLADVPKGAERVFASAMNRGISRAKTLEHCKICMGTL